MMENKTTAAALAEDLAAIYIGNLNTVEADLALPEKGGNGSRFVWDSGESRFIAADGRVYRPLYGMGNRKVHLKVTGFLEGETAVREFEATVLQEAKKTVEKYTRDNSKKEFIGYVEKALGKRKKEMEELLTQVKKQEE